MAKNLDSLIWIESLLPSGYYRKPMFGGLAYYINDRIVLALFESYGDRSYKNKSFDFDLWNGCLFPADRENHPEILEKYPFLINHPVLPKWFYLPAIHEDFEAHTETILRQIRKGSELFGTIPNSKTKKKSASKGETKLEAKLKSKTKTTSKTKAKRVDEVDEKIDTRRPRMFSDEPLQTRLKKASKISDLLNLGPSSELAFKKAGIKSVDAFVKMGWQKAMLKLIKAEPKNRHPIFAYAIIGALQNKIWNGISEQDKLAAREFCAAHKPRKKK